MIYYEDLLNVPYKPHGRNPQEGFDCIGLLLYCVKRAGKVMHDPHYDRLKVPVEAIKDYIYKVVNVREITGPRADALVSFSSKSFFHCGYLIDKRSVLHTTPQFGVRLSSLAGMNPAGFYEVVDESNMV